MWSSLLALALLSALSPLRLGLMLLVISRSRPVQNLFVYWAGCLTVSIPVVVVPVTLLHGTTIFGSLAQDGPASSTVLGIQIGMGVLALSIAALMTVRSLARRHQRAQLPTKGDTASTLVLDSPPTTPISRLLGLAQEAPTEGESAFRRLLRRVHNAWKNGSSWVAYLVGVGSGGPQPDEIVFVVAIIMASGAAIGTKIIAALAFVVGMLAIVEIMLVSYLIAPAKTLAMLQRLHNWAWAHRRKLLIAMLTVVGLALVANGMGLITTAS